MTAANLGGRLRAGGSAPRAVVSRGALAHNAGLAVATADAALVGDVRADAWGHGAVAVGRALLAAGVPVLRVDDAAAAALSAAGVADDAVSATAEPTLDPRTVLGLPGGDAAAEPALTLYGAILSVKPLLAGEGVSYGYRHRASADTTIALVTGGYAQGIVRSLGDRVEVASRAGRHAIVGRVAMDVCVVDIGGADLSRGDEIVFFGDPRAAAPSLAPWEAGSGLSAGEIVAVIGARALREDAA
ncbi:alanine racemase C-terminal domain-containing protein [Microbacterium thalassium]|uniref:Alanine racemase n=1 Tax=Microbacterium thalassium TaxID=362649 RepID=A0A7X0FRY8_9MICO|nr:alanine racemase C-terminal domain-containing protein [Microbacterium thalassium]MBB6391946.1 alanine racemase [Microbacterium thalassium]